MHLTCNEMYKEIAEAMDKFNKDYWESIKDNPNLGACNVFCVNIVFINNQSHDYRIES